MPHLSARWVGAVVAVSAGLMQTACSSGTLIGDAKSQPESLAATTDGTLIVGSASSHFIYKLHSGAASAEKFIDASSEGEGAYFLGMLIDASTNTLWACQLIPIAGMTPVQRHSMLRSFDLNTGSPKLRWPLPGQNTLCNDFSVGPDKALYISDTVNGRIYRLPAGGSSAELLLEDPLLTGIDGITFLDGVLYVDNLFTNKLYRIPIDNAGKASQPVDIGLDQPIKGPDGMRASNGKLLLAESGSGKVSVIRLQGDLAHVTTIKQGLKTPTGVEPSADTVWVTERGAGRVVSVPMPK